jgi:gas vesicle protein
MRSSNLGAFLCGALVGGVVALLVAPRSGAETRGMIRDFAQDELDMVKGKARQARDFVEDELDRYKAKARRVVDEAEDLAQDVKTFVEAERKKLTHPASATAARSTARSASATKATPRPARARKTTVQA